MPCFHPMRAYHSKSISAGTSSISFDPKSGGHPIKLPCGNCSGCRLDRAGQWAARIMHEASLYDDNCFITLTMNDDYICVRDSAISLDYREYQLFMKRLRKRFGSLIRFYMCGEYGDVNLRPHYHACIFNFDFADKVLWSVCDGVRLYTSSVLSDLWPYGFSTIGNLTFESAAYVARYVLKKQNGKAALDHYTDPITGEWRMPEFARMSLKPGIGAGWYDKFLEEVYSSDSILVNGKQRKPPRYYDKKLKASDAALFEEISFDRLTKALDFVDNTTTDRLAVRELVTEAKLKTLKRKV